MSREWIEDKAAAELDALALTIDDQAAFAQVSRRLLEDLDLADADDRAEEQPEAGGDEDQGEEPGADDSDEGDDGGASSGEMEMRGEEEADADEEQASSDEEFDGEEGAPGDEGSESLFPRQSRRNWLDEPVTDYRAFTTRHDEIVEAEELCDEEELTRLRAYLDQQMAPLQGVVTRLANRLAAAADGAAGAQLGIRPGGRPARRRAAGPRDRQPGAQLELQDRARDGVSRHGRQPADRQ